MTECITLSPLSDDQLMAALDGEADGHILSHLQACAYCSMNLEQIRKFEKGLHMVMYRSDCPSADELADYVVGEGDSERYGDIKQHLKRCVLCQTEIEALQGIMVADEETVPEQASPRSIWEQVEGWVENLENKLVTLLMPQGLVPVRQLAGALKGNEGRERILNYASESVTVMLRLEKLVDGLKINGLIIDNQREGHWVDAHVELTTRQADRHGRLLAITDYDETFTFERLTPGLFHMSIYAVDNHILRLNDIELTL